MVFKWFREDIDAYLDRDPAARSRLEVILFYPGFHALVFYRLAHGAWMGGWRMVGRLLSTVARVLTGIEIHPGATIGRRFVIDHGFGVVIGETSEIGDDVTLYQGVTLGGIAPAVDSHSQVDRKRHPTICDRVIIGSGAQVLGPITIGSCARIGANAVVTRDVSPRVTAVGIPARVVLPRDKNTVTEFVAYGTPRGGLPDPLARTIDNLRNQVESLMGQVAELDGRLRAREADDVTGRPAGEKRAAEK